MDEQVNKAPEGASEQPVQEAQTPQAPQRKPVVITKRSALSLLLVGFLLVFGVVNAIADLFRGDEGKEDVKLREAARELGAEFRGEMRGRTLEADTLAVEADSALVRDDVPVEGEGENKE